MNVCPIDHEYTHPMILRNFLNTRECDLILKLADKKVFSPSGVGLGHATNDAQRRSRTCWINQDESIDLFLLYHRVRELLGDGYEDFEPLQVVRYTKNDFFAPHYDQDSDPEDLKKFGGPRLCTILIYLDHPQDYKGGETVFPHLHMSFKGNKGDAMLFYNLDVSRKFIHPLSLHSSNEILDGVKNICNIWVRIKK